MNRYLMIPVAAGAIALGGAFPAVAQNDADPRSQQQNAQRSDSQSQSMKHQGKVTQTVQGQIQSMRKIQLGGERSEMAIAKLELSEGGTAIVLFGKAQEIDAKSLREADQLTVEGEAGRINGKPVLIANRIRIDGESMQTLSFADDNPQQMRRAERRMQRDQQRQQAQNQQRDQRRQQAQRDQRRQQAQRQQQRDQRRQQARGQQDTQRIQGELQSVRWAQLEGEDKPHLLARVETEQGRTIVMNLGARDELDLNQGDLRQGQTVRAEGQQGEISGMPVLVVYSFDLDRDRQRRQTAFGRDAQTTDYGYTDRGRRGREQNMRDQRQRYGRTQERLIQGEIRDITEVTVRGLPDAHRLARIERPDGQTYIVDFGKADSFETIDLTQGDRVFVYGKPAEVQGREVLFATHVAEFIEIDRDQRAMPSSIRDRGSQPNRD